MEKDKYIDYLVADTTAFIQNAQLQTVGAHIVTCAEVVNEITNKRQLRRLVVLPYDLVVKEVFPESIKIVTEFSKKTGDYPSLSATDIKVMALTYQLEKEQVGTDHLRTEPVIQKQVDVAAKKETPDLTADVTGFYLPNSQDGSQETDKLKRTNENDVEETEDVVQDIEIDEISSAVLDNARNEIKEIVDDVLMSVSKHGFVEDNDCSSDESFEDSDDDSGWITPSNVQKAKQQMNSELTETKHVKVACMTTDFAMQNVLKQMNLNVAALDGRMIKQLRTSILRCYTCFKTTSIMTKAFCPKCGNKTLKRVGVTLDEDGKPQIRINTRRPLTARGKKFSLPTIKGGKHSNNPILVADQPMPHQRPTRLARMKNNPMDDDYIAGYSPFVMRDINSKSAQLKIRPATEVKHWMRKNPNESNRRRKK